ncbi:DUF192 domain-containing protein [Salmonirosea aquatica]|uniref:DUF192 domain-containing protein n=1 Tax=Salmonirosea aquatica TaxID=2654236 RepID=A0A7C9BQM8_9BACT|nr:DUF192 domain-containing protein [Cytophagaceae bacterium SJW1-29]
MRARRSYSAYILLTVFVVGGLGYLIIPYLRSKSSEPVASIPTESASAPSFVKEGEVTFLSGGKMIKKIDVEIAENEAERNKGLMYRPYMPDSVGMLFIFQESAPLEFWMKNTQIPLDIIYVDSNKKIVSIQKNARPFSEENLPSYADAQYVVEVNAGYTDLHGIKVGDSIQF